MAESDEYTEIEAFLSILPEMSSEGQDWTEGLTLEELREHEAELQSVVDAQRAAEVLSNEFIVG